MYLYQYKKLKEFANAQILIITLVFSISALPLLTGDNIAEAIYISYFIGLPALWIIITWYGLTLITRNKYIHILLILSFLLFTLQMLFVMSGLSQFP